MLAVKILVGVYEFVHLKNFGALCKKIFCIKSTWVKMELNGLVLFCLVKPINYVTMDT